MDTPTAPRELLIIRQVFPTWSIGIPLDFAETFVYEDRYWHAYDDHRSVSLSSIVLTDDQGPVSADAILEQFPPDGGPPVDEVPPGLSGWAVTIDTDDEDARASRALTGILATHGRVLIATITSDDLEWARAIWLTIRHQVADLPSRWQCRDEARRRGRPARAGRRH